MTPAVSVLLPVRDGAATITQALESLLAQTRRDLEVVAVDDGSTDGTGDVLAAFARRDGRVRVLTRPPRGLVPALNEAIAAARAPFLARMDADDVAHPERLAAQLALLESRPELGLVGCLVETRAADGGAAGAGMVRYVEWSNRLTTPDQIARERFIESPVVHPTVVARRDVLTAYRDGPFAEDYDLWLSLLAAGVRMAKVPRTLLLWRDHGARATRRDARYGAAAMRALKLEHLLAGPLRGRDVVVWGAGLEGKPVLRALVGRGVRVPWVVEADPRKIGNVIHGAAVIGEPALDGALARTPGAVVLGAVGVAAARPPIRAALDARGLREGSDYWFVC